MMPYKGMEYLKRKLALKQGRISLRYKYYEMKKTANYLASLSLPSELRKMSHALGWCSKSVDAIADRLTFRGFDNDVFGLNEIYDMNNKDILTDGAMLGALITSCDFIYVSRGEKGFPRMQVIDGYDATGILDPITNMLTEGYAVLERDQSNKSRIILEAYFTQEETIVFDRLTGQVYREDNITPYALLVPIIHRPDARRPFGHSRITRAAMSIQESAIRTISQSEVSAEFYSYPQKYVLGTDPEAERLDKFRASVSTLLEITAGENGEKPTIGQFSQQSMSPYTDQLKMFASLFSGESGLTMDDLGFTTDNPASVEAIKACHENLRLSARKAQRDFAIGLKNAGYLAACLRDETAYNRSAFIDTKVLYEPLFELDMSSLSLVGDGAIKLNQAVPGYVSANTLRNLTGIDSGEPTQENQELIPDTIEEIDEE